MPTFILHIFPDSGLASSLITTVWIGVFVVCFFNLRFGWNLSGLIVPGYLVPLLILKPWSAVAIIIEALFTYFLIMFFSEFSSRLGRWSSLFGRDRFFAIILFSVVSRMLFDTILFPELTVFLNDYMNITFVYKGGLYSIGLVIVALIANQFWNPGIKRGFPQFLVTLFISFLIIRFVLLKYTNFRISEVAYMYEDIATSLAASPKAYIIFIVTAFLASRMNLLYGWEFGGIVLPALLALQWYYPWKIASSIFEAGIIYGLAVFVLKTPLFKNITIEGARKILLFFNIAFVYKMLIGFLLPLIIPDVRILDVYGLGYMLTSLIAIKMYDKKIGLKMTRTALQTSLLAVILATLIGFILMYIPTFYSSGGKETNTATLSHMKYKNVKSISEAVLNEQVRLYGYIKDPQAQTQIQLVSFKNSISSLRDYAKNKSEILLQYAISQLDHLGYNLEIIDDKYILLYEKSWKSSRGIFVIVLNPKKEILVEVPLPTQGPGLIESALLTVTNEKFSALAIAGGKNTRPGQLQSYLTNSKSFYNIFCDVFKSNLTLQFFRQDIYIKSLFKNNDDKVKKKSETELIEGISDYAYFSENMPKQNIKIISSLFPKITKLKQKPSFIQNDDNVVTLLLTPKTELNILTQKGKFDLDIPNFTKKGSIDSMFSEKNSIFSSSVFAITSLFSSKHNNEAQKNNPLNIEKGSYIDTQIITRIINLTDEYSNLPKNLREEKLKLISFAAKIVGCSVSTLTVEFTDSTYIVLKGYINDTDEYLGGTYVFKTSDYTPYTIEIISPSDKGNIKLGVYLSAYLKARACFISGSTKPSKFFSYLDDTPTDRSLFNLTNQIIMRETDSPASESKKDKNYRSTVVQISTISNPDGVKKYNPHEVFFSTYFGKFKKSQLNKQEEKIYSFLQDCNLKIRFDDGSPGTAGLAAVHSVQAAYLPQTKNTDFVLLWLTPNTEFSNKSFSKIESLINPDKDKSVDKDKITDKDKASANKQQKNNKNISE